MGGPSPGAWRGEGCVGPWGLTTERAYFSGSITVGFFSQPTGVVTLTRQILHDPHSFSIPQGGAVELEGRAQSLLGAASALCWRWTHQPGGPSGLHPARMAVLEAVVFAVADFNSLSAMIFLWPTHSHGYSLLFVRYQKTL